MKHFLNIFSSPKRINELKEALGKPKQIDEILDEQLETALREHNRSKTGFVSISHISGTGNRFQCIPHGICLQFV
ncbi:MAG: hypothetical protein R6W78_06255 [Bacteroidales bacterium]